jgi:hypothetical protein
MTCVNYEQDQEEGHYHFTLSELVYYISQYGIDKVMIDVYDYLEVEKNDNRLKVS